MNAPDLTHEQRFWFAMAGMSALLSADSGRWSLYERMKSAFVREFPDASPAEYEAAMQRIARMARV